MRLIRALPILGLVLPALCDDVASLISEIEPLITNIPTLIEVDGPAILDELGHLISEYAPGGVVSQLPGLLQSGEDVIASFLDGVITNNIPAGAVPTSIIAEIPELVSALVPGLVADLDSLISADLPATLADAAIPSVLATELPVLGTQLEAIASEELLVISSLLEYGISSSTGPANSTASPTTAVTKTTVSGGSSATSSSPTSSFTGAASALVWQSEIAGLVGFAAVVAML